MGGCFSSESDYSRHQKPSAIVVSLAGELRRYPLPVTVSEVLHSQTLSPSSFFLCNSDRLNFDDYIPPLEPQEELEPAQIYFVLPTAKLQHRLAATDMATLAVKASAALNAASNNRRNRKARISPVLVDEEDQWQSSRDIPIKISPVNNYYAENKNARKASSSSGLGVSRSAGSVRKLQRFSSRRAKLAVRSFRMRLSTINEGSVLLN